MILLPPNNKSLNPLIFKADNGDTSPLRITQTITIMVTAVPKKYNKNLKFLFIWSYKFQIRVRNKNKIWATKSFLIVVNG